MIYSSRKFSYLIILLLNFLTGIEYAVILPTALQYIKKLSNGDQFELGLCLSAYSFSSLFSSPIMGKWSDISRNTKTIMIVANMFQIAGSFMYFVGISSIFLISARLVAGIGMGIIGCCFSDIVKTTNAEERSPILSRIMAGRQIGMIIGPAFNFILLNLNVDLGPFHLDKLSAPGLLMCLLWIILQILIIFFYKNLHEFNIDEILSDSSSFNKDSSINDEQKNKDYGSINVIQDDSISNDPVRESSSVNEKKSETSAIINEPDISNNDNNETDKLIKRSNVSLRIVDNSESGPLLLRLYNEYVKEEVIAILCSTFCVFLMQTALETFLTPFTRDYFGWSDLQNSVLYAVAGFEIMLVFVLLSFLTKKIKDRTLLLTGLVLNLATLIFLLVYLPKYDQPKNPDPTKIPLVEYFIFMCPTFLNVFSLPLIVLASISLLSKITSSENQGLSQGLRRTVVGIACIIGPAWAGTFYKQWYIFFGTLIGTLGLSLIMVVLSFKYLDDRER